MILKYYWMLRILGCWISERNILRRRGDLGLESMYVTCIYKSVTLAVHFFPILPILQPFYI